MITDLLKQVVDRRDLTDTEAERAMDAIIAHEATDIQIGAFIAAMTTKGATPVEIAAFSRAMMKSALQMHPEVGGLLVDTCGTGGDGANTFNISTASAFVAAGAGIPVVKHGNNRVSSRCGSADVLACLGVAIDAPPAVVKTAIETAGIGFLYAKTHHPAMRHAGRAREEIGIRSFFNILGPVSNPASAHARLLGVYSPELTEPLAEVLRLLGVRTAMVVHGAGLDEITTTGTTKVTMLRETGAIHTFTITPESVRVAPAECCDLAGGDPPLNARIITEILDGEKGPCRDIVLLNAGAAIYLGGGARSIRDGIGRAETSIDAGRAAEKLARLREITGGGE
ncbi:MAG TPA: anthranilate phosphoribosyltransferase [Methanoculleus sp.]|nr:anthranilate phosphoribosyltransferase [Methanoculleus sp.]